LVERFLVFLLTHPVCNRLDAECVATNQLLLLHLAVAPSEQTDGDGVLFVCTNASALLDRSANHAVTRLHMIAQTTATPVDGTGVVVFTEPIPVLVDHAVAVVVHAVADFFRVGVDGGIGIVAIHSIRLITCPTVLAEDTVVVVVNIIVGRVAHCGVFVYDVVTVVIHPVADLGGTGVDCEVGVVAVLALDARPFTPHTVGAEESVAITVHTVVGRDRHITRNDERTPRNTYREHSQSHQKDWSHDNLRIIALAYADHYSGEPPNMAKLDAERKNI